jgi:hypothetical protein
MSNSEMNPNSNLIIQSQEDERMNIINVSDLESQYSITSLGKKNSLPIKGILKKPELFDSRNDPATIMATKICLTVAILAIMSPIIVADLYFGFSDSSCINYQPKNLAISMKLYLLVSGFVSIGVMLGFIINICCLSTNEDKIIINICCISCIVVIAGVFHLIWNIIGAIIFWGTVYAEENCNKNISTYIFVSLIIKFTGNLIGIIQSQRQNKE